jgi:hypothetical protein
MKARAQVIANVRSVVFSSIVLVYPVGMAGSPYFGGI